MVAFPAPGWEFLEWLVDGGQITDNPYTFEVSGDIALAAVFRRQVEAIPAAGMTGLVLLFVLLLGLGVTVLRRIG